MSENTIGAFLLPEGFRRPAAAALMREGYLAAEAGRSVVHAIGGRVARSKQPYAGSAVERVNQPVLLVPGFLAGDYTLRLMGARLREAGFRTYRAQVFANVDCTLTAGAQLEARLEEIAAKRESRVQIVGHSLGGMLARGLAARRPDLVSGVVTMGSPMMAPGAHHRLLTVGAAALVGLSSAGVPGVMRRECVGGDCARQSFDESRQALDESVEFTAIYSKRDGIVDWRSCIDPIATPIEVKASHVGLAIDPRVSLEVISALHRHRAAQNADAVTGFDSVLEVDGGVSA